MVHESIAPRTPQEVVQHAQQPTNESEEKSVGLEAPNSARSPYRTFAEVKAKDVDWVWAPYLPAGEVTVLEGDPGLGKSFLTLELAAAGSQGRPLPGQPAKHAAVFNTILISGEDSAEHTIKPRLQKLGASHHRIIDPQWNGIDFEPFPALNTNEGLGRLRQIVNQTGARLVVIDALDNFAGVDLNRREECRKVLTGLVHIAREQECAIIVVRHFNKNTETRNPIYRGSGSIAITGAARSVIAVAPESGADDDDTMVHLHHTKCNVAALGTSQMYRIVKDDDCGRFEWCGESHLGRSDIVADPDRRRTKIDEAAAWLRALLSDGSKSRQEVLVEGAKQDYDEKLLDRARKRAGITSTQEEGYGIGKMATWELP